MISPLHPRWSPLVGALWLLGSSLGTTQTKSIPASKPGAEGPAFSMAAWLDSIKDVNFDQWNRNHPGPHGNWFAPDSDECAKRYEITWGPLGIRTRMHDHTWGPLPAFRRAWPKRLLDANGELMFDCFEIIAVMPGSPADGHLQAGDLLIAMDGGLFRTAGALRMNQPLWKHQLSRGLEIDAGEKLDLAEGRGRVSFDIIRPDQQPDEPFTGGSISKDAQITDELPRTPGHEAELDAPVTAGQELTVLLELTRGGNGSCGAEFIRPRLEGPAGTLDLSNLRRISESTGWGSIRRGGIRYKGKEVAESLWNHAPGHFTWVVPPGYNRFRATLVSPPSAMGYKARLVTRTSPRALPAPLAAQHRVVEFPIPKIGSYGKTWPNVGDAKSVRVAQMTAEWLASHQQPDGSWKRNAGYTHNGYDTAWAGLGLLAHDDPRFRENIRKAAEFIAFDCPLDGWAVPSSMMIMFLSEYWLRTRDERMLVPISSMVERLRGEMVYGDWNGGHGHNPGYGGSGVSTGGSHIALAFALADLTPARAEEGIVQRMLARAQELAPDGFIPYGRSTSTRSFEPNLDGAGTYSGRHGPYLVASMIHGGPRLFTENARAMYERGVPGGIDQGHATQTLSTGWALVASAICDQKILERQMDALCWKFTMMRCHDGGFGWNAYRLEYMGGEGLLPGYLRAGNYLVVYNAHKKNLAMTGAPRWRAKTFPDLPPVCHEDAVTLGYYQRNWGVADTVLGKDSPPELKAGLKKILAMGKGKDTRGELFDFLRKSAVPVAETILSNKTLTSPLRPYLAEMIVGADLRVSVEPDKTDDKPVPGKWRVQLDAQHPLAGWLQGADKEQARLWREAPPLPMEGQLEILNAEGKALASLPIRKDFGGHGWHTRSESQVIDGPAAGPLSLIARFTYRIGNMNLQYDRPVIAGGDEPGNGEKGRKVLGDRVVWVPGTLAQDLSGWNASFHLPSGQFIAAATQGVASRVSRAHETWISPQQGSVPAGTPCEFGYHSGWQYFEARVASIRLTGFDEIVPKSITAGGGALDIETLMDHDRGTGHPAPKGEMRIELAKPETIRGIDLRVKPANNLRVKVFVGSGAQEKLVFLGRPTERCSAFDEQTTGRVRVVIEAIKGDLPPLVIEELRLIRSLGRHTQAGSPSLFSLESPPPNPTTP